MFPLSAANSITSNSQMFSTSEESFLLDAIPEKFESVRPTSAVSNQKNGSKNKTKKNLHKQDGKIDVEAQKEVPSPKFFQESWDTRMDEIFGEKLSTHAPLDRRMSLDLASDATLFTADVDLKPLAEDADSPEKQFERMLLHPEDYATGRAEPKRKPSAGSDSLW